nr:hypothetical protein [Mycobacteroides abscessus]
MTQDRPRFGEVTRCDHQCAVIEDLPIDLHLSRKPVQGVAVALEFVAVHARADHGDIDAANLADHKFIHYERSTFGREIEACVNSSTGGAVAPAGRSTDRSRGVVVICSKRHDD